MSHFKAKMEIGVHAKIAKMKIIQSLKDAQIPS